MKIKEITEKAMDLLYPKGLTCNGCGRELNDEEREYAICVDCAKYFNPAGEQPVIFGDVSVYAAFLYDGLVRKYVLDYKDSNKPFLAEYMAKYLYEIYLKMDVSAERICYVPSSESARRRRGYDGMKYVAEEFSKMSGLPLEHILFRREGDDQTKVEMENRRTNVKNKFLCRSGIAGNVLLLDDVATSGATVAECVATLKSHGADSVTVLTFAMARHKKQHRVDDSAMIRTSESNSENENDSVMKFYRKADKINR